MDEQTFLAAANIQISKTAGYLWRDMTDDDRMVPRPTPPIPMKNFKTNFYRNTEKRRRPS